MDQTHLAEADKQSHAIIFVSKIEQSDVDDSLQYVNVSVSFWNYSIHAQSLNDNGCHITLVAMGNSLNLELLKDLTPYVIQWDIDAKSTPDNWEAQFWTSYGCG